MEFHCYVLKEIFPNGLIQAAAELLSLYREALIQVKPLVLLVKRFRVKYGSSLLLAPEQLLFMAETSSCPLLKSNLVST
jgi:hypothetical protein